MKESYYWLPGERRVTAKHETRKFGIISIPILQSFNTMGSKIYTNSLGIENVTSGFNL